MILSFTIIDELWQLEKCDREQKKVGKCLHVSEGPLSILFDQYNRYNGPFHHYCSVYLLDIWNFTKKMELIISAFSSDY